jgi:hypothetical protein
MTFRPGEGATATDMNKIRIGIYKSKNVQCTRDVNDGKM